MKENKNKGFTLVELIAVLVILALIALIVTPLVMNIVKRAKNSANERSVDAYGKVLELSVANYLLEHKEYPTSLEGLKVEYTGSEVICGIKKLNEDGSIYLSKCSVAGIEVKDISTDDGWYHYGKSAEILYQAYEIGDVVSYKGINFYVIANSDKNTDYVTLLKETPLTVAEVNSYGKDSNGINHVNNYIDLNHGTVTVGTARDINGYGGVAYYTSETCGVVNDSWISSGCITDYNNSEIKYVVDAWGADKLAVTDLKEDSLGYKVRLIARDDLINNLGYDDKPSTTGPSTNGQTPNWVYNNNYDYYTMNPFGDSNSSVWFLQSNGILYQYGTVYDSSKVIRPVINLLKTAI